MVQIKKLICFIRLVPASNDTPLCSGTCIYTGSNKEKGTKISVTKSRGDLPTLIVQSNVMVLLQQRPMMFLVLHL